jgi:CubicO group peptidase (beta-lactamase class C family)
VSGRRLFGVSSLVVVIGSFSSAMAQSGAAHPGGGNPDLAAIDAYVEREKAALRIPGLALAIVKGDQVVHLRGFGVTSRGGGSVRPQTPFIIGSLSKSFTALLVMQLVEAGKVSLDAPVRRYLPWFQLADEGAARITIRQLLNHTSGLPTSVSAKSLISDDTGEGALERRVRGYRTEHLDHPPGTHFEYSGANYAILGSVAEAVGGVPFEAYIREHIFRPLQMQHSFASWTEALPAQPALGHTYWFGFPFIANIPFNRGSVAQGYLLASAEDMAHYLIFHLGGGPGSLLSTAGIDELHRGTIETGESTSYAMGWYRGPIGSVDAIWHSGDALSYSANMALLPVGDWGVVLLKNSFNPLEYAQSSRMFEGIVRMLAGREPTPDEPNWMLRIAYLALTGLIFLQFAGMARTLMLLRRWRLRPATRPRRGPLLVRTLIAGLVNGGWGLGFLVGVPVITLTPLAATIRAVPDLGFVLLASATIALAWSILRTLLVVRAVGNRSAVREILSG